MYRTEIHDAYETLEAIRTYYDITERRQLLSEYQCGRHLDKDHAVQIIYDLRSREPLEYVARRLRNLPYGSCPLEVMSDQNICGELNWQIEYLELKCLSKAIVQLFQNNQEAPHANP